MRATLLLLSILLMPGAALAGGPLQCPSLPGSIRMADAAPATGASAPTPPSPSAPRQAATLASDQAVAPPNPGGEGASILHVMPTSEVTKSPALKHIADTGAQIEELGTSHGLQTVVARQGEQFMLLEVAPDGEAVVAGLQSDLSIPQLTQLAGSQVTELGTVHGLRGLLLRNGQQFQVLYATPDGARVIPGVMWDSSGKNVTRDQVTPIAGTIPTVVVGTGGPPSSQEATVAPRAASSLLAAANDTSFGGYGDAAAPRLWMFIDPQCPFSIRAMQQLQPLVDAKKVQLAVIPLSVIDYENQGQSTKSALAMLSKPAGEMVSAWRAGHLTGEPQPSAAANLRRNMAAAETVGLRGTPTFIWRKADGSEARSDGLPPDLTALIESLGG